MEQKICNLIIILFLFALTLLLSATDDFFYPDKGNLYIRESDLENCTCYIKHPLMSGMFEKIIFEPLDCIILKIKCWSVM